MGRGRVPLLWPNYSMPRHVKSIDISHNHKCLGAYNCMQYAQKKRGVQQKYMALTDAQKRANNKYRKEKTEQINFRAPLGTKDILKQLSISESESMQRYIIRACYMRARACGADSNIYKGLPWCDGLEDNQDSTRQPGENIDSV